MYSIFHPLDVNERLPRELMLESRRPYLFNLRLMELLGFTYLPALVLAVVVMASAGVRPLVAFAVVGVALVGIFVYVIAARFR